MSMIERVRDAILKAQYYDPEPEAYGHSLELFRASTYPEHVDEATAMARAAIEAMMDPTDRMIDAGYEDVRGKPVATWKLMIRAALEAEGGQP